MEAEKPTRNIIIVIALILFIATGLFFTDCKQNTKNKDVNVDTIENSIDTLILWK